MRATLLALAMALFLTPGAVAGPDDALFQDTAIACAVPLAGSLRGQAPASPEGMFQTVYCIGIFDAAISLGRYYFKCIPPNTMNGQVAESVLERIREHPDGLRDPYLLVIFKTFDEKWGCNTKRVR